MKRVRCPKCDNYIIFDPTRYAPGQMLVFSCTACSKKFAIRLGSATLHTMAGAPAPPAPASADAVGEIIVLENMFAYKQVLPLAMGDNVIGRYQQGQHIQCPIESSDPSLDMSHCVLTVKHDKHGQLCYVLRDGPSFTGTFVGDELLRRKEQRVITDGTLFTLGATTILLRTKENEG